MKFQKFFQILFLCVASLTILEFIFIKGMFTWLLAVSATIVCAMLNILFSLFKKEWLMAYFYFLFAIALCMGYFALA